MLTFGSLYLNFLKKDTVSVSGSKLLKETREMSTVSSVYKISLNRPVTTKNNMHRENRHVKFTTLTNFSTKKDGLTCLMTILSHHHSHYKDTRTFSFNCFFTNYFTVNTSSKHSIFFFFWPRLTMAWRMLVLQPGIEPMP